jgi:hypothetical protein
MNLPAWDAQWGEVQQEFRWRRLFAVLIACVGVVFTAIMLDALFLHIVLPGGKTMATRLLFLLILLFAGLISVHGVWLFFNPVLMHAATDRGIVTFLGSGGVKGSGALIPWQAIDTLELAVIRVNSGGRTARTRVVVVGLYADSDWTPPDTLSTSERDGQPVVYLDAFSVTPHGQAMLACLQSLHAAATDTT